MADTVRMKNGDSQHHDRAKSIASELLSRITAREYTNRLPAERLLAQEFNVPRHTVRAALDLLEERSAIERRAGSGSFVSAFRLREDEALSPAPHHTEVAENTGPLELQVVRGIFEPELVRLAVIHASPKDIDALRMIVEQMEAIQADWEGYVQCEEEFYLRLACATENPLLIAIYELVTDVRRLAHWRTQRKKMLSPSRIRERQGRHRSMFDAIEDRDIERAVEYVRLLLFDEQRALTQET